MEIGRYKLIRRDPSIKDGPIVEILKPCYTILATSNDLLEILQKKRNVQNSRKHKKKYKTRSLIIVEYKDKLGNVRVSKETLVSASHELVRNNKSYSIEECLDKLKESGIYDGYDIMLTNRSKLIKILPLRTIGKILGKPGIVTVSIEDKKELSIELGISYIDAIYDRIHLIYPYAEDYIDFVNCPVDKIIGKLGSKLSTIVIGAHGKLTFDIRKKVLCELGFDEKKAISNKIRSLIYPLTLKQFLQKDDESIINTFGRRYLNKRFSTYISGKITKTQRFALYKDAFELYNNSSINRIQSKIDIRIGIADHFGIYINKHSNIIDDLEKEFYLYIKRQGNY